MTNETIVKQGSFFCFTQNLDKDSSIVPQFQDDIKFVYQLELGDGTESNEGILHWQGYIETPKRLRLKALKSMLPTAHWENRKGTQEQAYNYCIKERTQQKPPVFNFTPTESSKGSRSDLELAREIICKKRNRAELYQDPLLDEVMSKFPKWAIGVFTHQKTIPDTEFIPYPWQKSLIEELTSTPHPREIIWVYDTEGNKGKSSLCTYLARNYGALVIENCKTADLAHAYDNHQIVCWDLVRTDPEKVNYSPMESVKNGRIFSPKYESTVKYFPVPHVIICANFKCPEGIFSADRLRFICLDDLPTIAGELFPIFNPNLQATSIQERLAVRKAQSVENYCKKCQLHKDVCRCLYRQDSSPGMFETHL